MAFLRISIYDGATNGRVLSQRVVPVRCIRPGYRHLPLVKKIFFIIYLRKRKRQKGLLRILEKKLFIKSVNIIISIMLF